jgi:O-antigen ligase
MDTTIRNREAIRAFCFVSLLFACIVILISLLTNKSIPFLKPFTIIGSLIFIWVLLIQQYELATGLVLLASLYLDWYLSYRVVALSLVLVLLILFFLNRSSQYPWIEPPALWLWLLFLGLAIFPAIHGALTVHDLVLYYPSVIFGALIMSWLGLLIGRDMRSIRRIFIILSFFSTLIAIHTIIQARAGITLLESQAASNYLASASNYQLPGESTNRLGSFFIQPNFNGMFLAMMAFIACGLFVESQFLVAKLFFLAQILLILTGLLFTYSASAWLGMGVAIAAFVFLVGNNRHRLHIAIFICITAAFLCIFFLPEINLILEHASDPTELSLRNAVWQTAWRVIVAYPLTGVGLGHQAYLERANRFRVLQQVLPFDHPHNSYLEWGAMAGLPVLLVFLMLLSFTLWQAFRNWTIADQRARSLLGGGIASIIVLCVTSYSNQGWTLPPLAACGWIIMGSITSPLLRKSLMETRHEKGHE